MSNPTRSFLEQLFDDGHVRVSDKGLGSEESARLTLLDFERRYRQHLPGQPPDLQIESAVWGATLLFDAVHGIADRTLGPDIVGGLLRRPCPAPASASTAYSADLTLRFLPDVVRLARAAADQDPLLNELARVASEWPLSSVGMPNVEIPPDDPVVNEVIVRDECLRKLYVDRIIAHSDVARMRHPVIQAAVRAAIGCSGLASPRLAEALRVEPDGPDGVQSADPDPIVEPT